jgi:hypothetical protein
MRLNVRFTIAVLGKELSGKRVTRCVGLFNLFGVFSAFRFVFGNFIEKCQLYVYRE